MKVLIIMRLFTGLIDSVVTKMWQPKGIPAIYKLIEGLNKKGISIDVLFLGKTTFESERIKESEVFKLKGLDNVKFHIIPFLKILKDTRRLKLLRGIQRLISNVSQYSYCLSLVRKNNYDLIYCDRVNVTIGAFFAFFMRQKVVLRLLGIKQDMRSLKTPLIYISYLAPFKYIIATQDGSQVEYFISKINQSGVPYKILLNGVEKIEYEKIYIEEIKEKYELNDKFPIILFVGKMEPQKGCKEFIQVLIELSKINQKFYAILVGEGPLLKDLNIQIEKNGLDKRVIFIGAVDHRSIYKYYKLADIYVSLNFLGNLSNTVLEAIYAGKCLVLLDKDTDTHTDESTEKIIPKDCALRVDRNRIIEELPLMLNDLINNPEKIEEMSRNVKKLSKKILKSWDERIDYEVNILQKL